MAERQPSKLAVVGSTPIARFQCITINSSASSGIDIYLIAIDPPIPKLADGASSDSQPYAPELPEKYLKLVRLNFD